MADWRSNPTWNVLRSRQRFTEAVWSALRSFSGNALLIDIQHTGWASSAETLCKCKREIMKRTAFFQKRRWRNISTLNILCYNRTLIHFLWKRESWRVWNVNEKNALMWCMLLKSCKGQTSWANRINYNYLLSERKVFLENSLTQ